MNLAELFRLNLLLKDRLDTPNLDIMLTTQLEHLTEDNLNIYDMYRDYVKQEDTLINFRSSWILAIQAFLYATYGAVLSKQFDNIEKITDLKEKSFLFDKIAVCKLEKLDNELAMFLFTIAIAGIIISWLGFLSIRAAHMAIINVEKIFKLQHRVLQSGQFNCREIVSVTADNTQVLLPNIVAGGGGKKIFRHGSWASRFIPLVLIGIWVIALATLLVVEVPSHFG
jgi:hypothetical protein